jgi:hypothetical protein
VQGPAQRRTSRRPPSRGEGGGASPGSHADFKIDRTVTPPPARLGCGGGGGRADFDSAWSDYMAAMSLVKVQSRTFVALFWKVRSGPRRGGHGGFRVLGDRDPAAVLGLTRTQTARHFFISDHGLPLQMLLF